MSQLTVDIVARVNDTLKKLGATEAQIRDINDALKATQPAAKASTAAMNDLGAASAKAGAAARGSSQKFFQAGQAISDFSVAGIRGAANNLEFLALQMGVGGPLLLGIAAATSALVVFGDDILRALDPIGQRAEEIKSGLEDVLTVISEERPDLVVLERQLPDAIDNIRGKISGLQSLIVAKQGGRDLGLSAFLPSLFASDDDIRRLSHLEAVLAEFEEQYDRLRIRAEAFEAARNSNAVQANDAAVNELRTRIESLGLAEQAKKLDNEALIRIIERKEEDELIADLKKKHARATREEVTELDRATKKASELADELERRRSGELSTLDALRDQAAELQRQITVVKKLDEARRAQAERDALFGAPQRAQAAGQQRPSTSIADTLDILRKAQRERQEEQERGTIGSDQLRTIPERAIEEVQALTDAYNAELDAIYSIATGIDRTSEAFDRAGIKASDFYLKTKDGQQALVEGLQTTAGNFADAFSTAYDITGQKQAAFFKAYKAFAIAEATIATYNAATQALKAGPILGPILAAGVIAAGLANVAKIASIQPGGGSGGGRAGSIGGGSTSGPLSSSFERLPNGAVVPAASAQPSPPARAPGYTPLPPGSTQTVIVEGRFDLEGENLRAAVRNTDKRVQSTRGVAA